MKIRRKVGKIVNAENMEYGKLYKRVENLDDSEILYQMIDSDEKEVECMAYEESINHPRKCYFSLNVLMEKQDEIEVTIKFK